MANNRKILKGIGWGLISLLVIAATVFFVQGQLNLKTSIEPDGDMDPGEKVVDILQVGQGACTTSFTVAPPAEPALACTAKRAWKNEASNTATSYNLVEEITKVDPGDIVVYELSYSSTDIDSLAVTDTLDSNVTFLDSASGCTHASGTVSCSVNTSTSPSGTVLFRVEVDSGLSETTTISNTATLTNNAEGLSDSCSVDVTYTHVDPGTPTLSCTNKKAWKNEASNTATSYNLVEEITKVDPGDMFVYELAYSSSEITSMAVTDALDSDLTFVDSTDGCTYSSSTNTVSCDVNTSVAASGSVLFRVEVDSGLSETTTISNTATLRNIAENLSDTCSRDVTYTHVPAGGANVSCTIKRIYEDDARNTSGFYYLENQLLNTSSVNVGDKIIYNIAVANSGDIAASDVLITDSLPGTVSYVDSDSECSYDSGTGVVSCDIGALAAGGEDSSSIRVSVAGAGSISNTANISSANGQSDTCSITVDAEGTTVSSPTPTPPPVVVASPTPSELPEAGIMTFTAGSIGAGILLLLLGALGLLIL